MNKISSLLPIVLIVLLSTAACKTTYTHDTGKSLGQSFFKILQKNDQDGLKNFLPTKEDILYVMSVSDVPEDVLANIRTKIEDEDDPIWQELQLKSEAHWEQLQQDMEDAGFDPRKARYRTSKIRLLEEKKFVTADIDVWMDFADALYAIRINEAGQVPRGWLIGGDGFEWLGKVEE